MITENDKKYVTELWECYQNGIKKLGIKNKADEKELFTQLIEDAVKQIKVAGAEQNPCGCNCSTAGPGSVGAGLKDGEVKGRVKLFLEETERHIQSCRRFYKQEYQYEVDEMEKDYRALQILLGESLSV
jgi:hypothetical protein